MKYIVRNFDEEIYFLENEVDKAREYWEIEETCEDLEDVAMWWNMHHAGDAEGELIVKTIEE